MVPATEARTKVHMSAILTPPRRCSWDPAEARPLAERALAITEATYGPVHPTTAAFEVIETTPRTREAPRHEDELT